MEAYTDTYICKNRFDQYVSKIGPYARLAWTNTPQRAYVMTQEEKENLEKFFKFGIFLRKIQENTA